MGPLQGPQGARDSAPREAVASGFGLRLALRIEPSERSEAGVLGTTKEVLGFIIDFLHCNLDFLGFPILLL